MICVMSLRTSTRSTCFFALCERFFADFLVVPLLLVLDFFMRLHIRGQQPDSDSCENRCQKYEGRAVWRARFLVRSIFSHS